MNALCVCVVCYSFCFLPGGVKLNCYLDEIDSSTMFVFETYEGDVYMVESSGFLFSY